MPSTPPVQILVPFKSGADAGPAFQMRQEAKTIPIVEPALYTYLRTSLRLLNQRAEAGSQRRLSDSPFCGELGGEPHRNPAPLKRQ